MKRKIITICLITITILMGGCGKKETSEPMPKEPVTEEVQTPVVEEPAANGDGSILEKISKLQGIRILEGMQFKVLREEGLVDIDVDPSDFEVLMPEDMLYEIKEGENNYTLTYRGQDLREDQKISVDAKHFYNPNPERLRANVKWMADLFLEEKTVGNYNVVESMSKVTDNAYIFCIAIGNSGCGEDDYGVLVTINVEEEGLSEYEQDIKDYAAKVFAHIENSL